MAKQRKQLQNSNKIIAFPGLASSGFEQPAPGAPLLGLAKSIYQSIYKL